MNNFYTSLIEEKNFDVGITKLVTQIFPSVSNIFCTPL